MNDKKHVIIVGAGPGGLTAGMILSHRGFKVTIFEKADTVGGRNRPLKLGEYTFDIGPTFLNLRFILDEVFEETGRKVEDYLHFKKIDPLYRLQFHDKELFPSSDYEKMKEEISKHFPGNEKGLDLFYRKETVRFEKLFPCLQKGYSRFSEFFDPIFLRAVPYISMGRTLFQNLGRYFDHDDLKLAFTFQSKYLGMSPWKCPALFTILSYMEHKYGIYHTIGGLNRISHAMSRVIKEEGGEIHTGTSVAQLLVEGKTVKGVTLENGENVYADDVIINADFSYAMSELVPLGILKKYGRKQLEKKKYSCATFMIYLGINTCYELPHHTIFFAKEYRRNVEDIFERHLLSKDMSIYVQNAVVSDPTLAPHGKSTLYILVPVPNNRSGIDWEDLKEDFKNTTLDYIIERAPLPDLRKRIEVEHVITPQDWERDYNIYIAAEFNLAHTMDQMLYFRPRNKFEELQHCYLVGGGTHPGSGLPTIYESGRISSNLLCRSYNIPFTKPSSLKFKERATG